jgi:hypothetical protein
LVEFDPDSVADLRALPSSRLRIRGTAYNISLGNRVSFGGTEYLLVHEEDNVNDSNAVAIYGNGLKVGYVSASKEGSFAPLLDRLPASAFKVGGSGVSGESIQLWVDLPTLTAMRAFVKSNVA